MIKGWQLCMLCLVISGFYYSQKHNPYVGTLSIILLWVLARQAASHFFPIVGAGYFLRPDHFINVGFNTLLCWLGFHWRKCTHSYFSYWLSFIGVTGGWLTLYERALAQSANIAILPQKQELFFVGFLFFNLLYLLVGLLVKKNLFTILGSVGILHSLLYLGGIIFENTIVAPFIFPATILLMLILGILYKKNEEYLQNTLLKFLPYFIKRKLLEYRLENTKHD